MNAVCISMKWHFYSLLVTYKGLISARIIIFFFKKALIWHRVLYLAQKLKGILRIIEFYRFCILAKYFASLKLSLWHVLWHNQWTPLKIHPKNCEISNGVATKRAVNQKITISNSTHLWIWNLMITAKRNQPFIKINFSSNHLRLLF